MQDFQIEESFPAIITPKRPIKLQELFEDLPRIKSRLEQLLLKQGALLFRGFPFKTPDEFSQFIETLKLGKFINYVVGDSPRNRVKSKVYTSTEAPAAIHLPLHQELSYNKYYPQHIYFFCQIAPKDHGETIIANAREVYRALNSDVIQQFQQKKITYISHYYYKDYLMKLFNRYHKSWMEVFETKNKSLVEQICLKNEITFQWLPKDWIEIKQTRPALLTHHITNETVWFNQAHLYDFNPKLLGYLKYIASKILYARPLTNLHEVTFGDGSPIPRQDLYHILDVLQKKTVANPWQEGDVMVLDNVLSMHGRATFKGDRRVLTALTV